MTDTSTARVTTGRPGRYAKQLVSHMSRRAQGTYDEAGASGTVTFADAELTLTAATDALLLSLSADSDHLPRMEDVVGRHLVRFGTRDELVVEWVRSDGTAGSVQRNTDD